MQKPDRFTKPWHARVEMLMAIVHQVSAWLLPALILALALGIGFTTPSLTVQAQDGGTQTGRVTYRLTLDTEGVNLDRFCLGHTARLPVLITRSIEVEGEPNAGAVRILRTPNLRAESQDPAVLQVQISSAGLLDPNSNVPFRSLLTITGVSPGRSTVFLRADFETATHEISVFYSTSVRVVPCAIRVQMSTVWTTTMRSASVVLITAIPGTVLTFPEFSGLAPHVNASMTWDVTANRIRGCRGVSHVNFRDFADTVVHLEDNNIRVDIEFNNLLDATTLFTCDRGDTSRARGCGDLPDGTCYPEYSPNDFWSIERLRVDLPLRIEPQTVRVPLRLTHANGSADATAIITVTVIPRP